MRIIHYWHFLSKTASFWSYKKRCCSCVFIQKMVVHVFSSKKWCSFALKQWWQPISLSSYLTTIFCSSVLRDLCEWPHIHTWGLELFNSHGSHASHVRARSSGCHPCNRVALFFSVWYVSFLFLLLLLFPCNHPYLFTPPLIQTTIHTSHFFFSHFIFFFSFQDFLFR